MCGLIGLISRRQHGFLFSDLDIYEQMLLINSLRGKDSTGVFTRFRNGDVRVIKHGSHPYNLFRTNEWKDFKQAVINRGKFIIGHNRAATRGVVNTDNAHPFVENNIILVHNGTLREQGNLTNEKTDVDSHAIAHALATGSYAEVLPKINGAFALIWYDTVADRLYATRNEERPLSLMVTNEQYMLTSEPWIAGMPTARGGAKITETINIEPGEVFVFTPDGKYEVEKVALNAKKDHSGDAEDYEVWKAHVRRTLGFDPDEQEETKPPFEEGTETPDTKALRKALVEKAGHGPAVQVETTKSFPRTTLTKPLTSCALTHPEGTTTPTPSSSSDEQQVEARLVSMHSVNTNFPRDLTVLVRVMSTTRMVNNRFRFNGIIYTPELERMDVQGFLPHDVLPSELATYLDTICVSKVQFCTYSTNGGWTIHVRDTKKATYTQVHEKDVPIMWWDFAKNHCQCSDCNRNVEAWEKSFTSVKLGGEVTLREKPTNTVVMVCPDCITKKIEKEGFRDRFQTKYKLAKESILKARAAAADRNIAVQDRESISPQSAGTNGNIVALPAPTTIQ